MLKLHLFKSYPKKYNGLEASYTRHVAASSAGGYNSLLNKSEIIFDMVSNLLNSYHAFIKVVLAITICLVIADSNALAQQVGEDDGGDSETQYRPEIAFRINIYKDLETTIETRAIVRRGTDEFRDRYSLTYTWQPSKYIEIEPEYLFQAERETRGETEFEHRLRFFVTGILPYKKWRLSNRNLIERRYIEGEKSFRYRNRPQLEREFTVRGKKFNAYVLDEAYYDSRVRTWRFNRVYAGVERDLNKRLSTEIYYFRQNGKTDLSPDLHVIGTELSVRLR